MPRGSPGTGSLPGLTVRPTGRVEVRRCILVRGNDRGMSAQVGSASVPAYARVRHSPPLRPTYPEAKAPPQSTWSSDWLVAVVMVIAAVRAFERGATAMVWKDRSASRSSCRSFHTLSSPSRQKRFDDARREDDRRSRREGIVTAAETLAAARSHRASRCPIARAPRAETQPLDQFQRPRRQPAARPR